jgi:caffeoyl-CoA O-methyltransferase
MSARTITLTDELLEYVDGVGVREPEILRRLRAETAPLPEHDMQIGPIQGAFMALLVRLIGATRCLEIGTFTGYSSTVVALALPHDGIGWRVMGGYGFTPI